MLRTHGDDEVLEDVHLLVEHVDGRCEPLVLVLERLHVLLALALQLGRLLAALLHRLVVVLAPLLVLVRVLDDHLVAEAHHRLLDLLQHQLLFGQLFRWLVSVAAANNVVVVIGTKAARSVGV